MVRKISTAAQPSAGAGPVDTFRLNPKLTRRLHVAAKMTGAAPEWLVGASLVSMIESIDDDSDVCGTMAQNYRIDEKNKTRCIVQLVGGVR